MDFQQQFQKMENAGALPINFCTVLVVASTRVRLLLFLAGLLILLPRIAAQSQDGFISIDCGSTSNYTDSTDKTGLVWTSDDGYITTGVNKKVDARGQREMSQQLSSARYFPQSRKKNCYILPATANSSYLIRSTFLYGDTDVSLPPFYSFNLSIDSTIVGSVILTASNASQPLTYEYVVVSMSQQIAFCLIPIVGNPFISSLELRPLPATMYGGLLFREPLYMILSYRSNCGQPSTAPIVRFPDDIYDRFWIPSEKIFPGSISSVSATANLESAILYDSPPQKVMQSAWRDESFWFYWPLYNSLRFYANLYFQEIVQLKPTVTRVEDVNLNNLYFSTNFSVPTSAAELIFNGSHTETSYVNFTVSRHPLSTLPPILNAAELFAVYNKTTSTTDPADVSALYDLRQSLNLLDWTGDPCLPVSWDWLDCSSDDFPSVTRINLSRYQLTGTIPSSIANLTNLTDLWLDSNFFTGPIPNLANLIQLKTLHLQNNTLNGSIPASLADIPDLSELFLRSNHLSGPVPPDLQHKSGLNLQVDSSLNFSASPGPSSKSKSSWAVVGTVIGVVVVVAILILLCICLLCRRSKAKSRSRAEGADHENGRQKSEAESRHPQRPSVPTGGGGVQITKAFSQAEVQNATNNFSQKIGEGGFGTVYYGRLDSGEEVAVKLNSDTSGQGSLEFSTEVSLLSRVHHRNLVSLVGFCDDGNTRILVYEFMQNGTLREHLYGRGVTMVMDWKTRLDVALNAARGLEYLHCDCIPRIIHRDVKSSNILLNEKMLAKVADFGISKATPDEEKATTTDISSVVRGTTGYMDPEYLTTNKLTYRSDVYAFGVVLLELISGRAPIDQRLAQKGHPYLVDYARRMLRGNNLEAIVDPSLKGSYNLDAMWKLAELAMTCVEPVSKNRPDMRGVVQDLIEAVRFEEGQNSMTETSTLMSPALFTSKSISHGSHPYGHLSEPPSSTSPTSYHRPDDPTAPSHSFLRSPSDGINPWGDTPRMR